MHSGDREEFENQVRTLCAGFNVPPGDRIEAYWRGLAKMDLPTFARVVEHALGADGPEKIPTTGQCWQISKQMRSRPRVFEHEKPADTSWHGDAWERIANYHLFDYLQVNVRTRPSGRYGTSRYVAPGVPLEISPTMHERVRCLIDAKGYWAIEMREGGEADRTPANQKRIWNEFMVAAEKRIDELIARDAARAAQVGAREAA